MRDGLTQAQVAQELGISQQQVQKIERNALKKLSKNPQAKALLLHVINFVPDTMLPEQRRRQA